MKVAKKRSAKKVGKPQNRRQDYLGNIKLGEGQTVRSIFASCTVHKWANANSSGPACREVGTRRTY